MVNKKEAQASVEFMSTYIWVGVAILIAVGAIAYYHSTLQTAFERADCYTGNQLTCVDAVAFEDGTFVMMLSNQINKDIRIQRVELTNLEPPFTKDNINLIVDVTQNPTIILNTPQTFPVGELIPIDLTIAYQTTLNGENYVISGSAIVEVLAGHDPYTHPFCGDGEENQDHEQCDPPGTDTCGTGFTCSSLCQCVRLDQGPYPQWET